VISHTSTRFARHLRTFPAGPLERDPHSSTLHLAYNAQNSVVHAYENALSELLTKLDAVESHGFKAVRDARKELVVQIERESGELEMKVVQALAVGKEEGNVEEKVEETMGGEQVEKAVVEVVHMEYRPSVAPKCQRHPELLRWKESSRPQPE
jgi:hypothetical protein